jgi:hypothetical protein
MKVQWYEEEVNNKVKVMEKFSQLGLMSIFKLLHT